MSDYQPGDLNRRNTATMTDKLEEMNQRLYAQDEKLTACHNTIATFAAKINALEHQLLMYKVKTTGTGPSA